ncbi:MAG: HXXEE domain-containing protein [Deltaproteobacteria bacterium]|nr:MAG: HXXEE domain-containing protein [Deltaproteobacteria bacterium]
MPWITFENLYFLFLLAVTLHNLEEAVWLPDWSQQAGRWHRPVEKIPFRFAVLVLTLLAYLCAYLGLMGGKQSVGIYLLGGYAFVMLVNVFFPPLLAAVWLQQYVPGLGTALALNLPVCSGLLFVVLKEDYVSPWPLLITGCIFAGGALILIRVLFKLGERVEEKYWH